MGTIVNSVGKLPSVPVPVTLLLIEHVLGDFRCASKKEPSKGVVGGVLYTVVLPVSYTHLTLPTIYSV